jgi:outer membrane protein assembly factor BamE
MRLVPWLLVAVPLVAACNPLTAFSVYRMEIQQGNYISQEAVSQLKLGMTKEQVRFVLGTPLVADIFHENRWDYVYRRQRANSREVEERRVSVFFEGEKLVRLEGDVMPSPGGSSAARDEKK